MSSPNHAILGSPSSFTYTITHSDPTIKEFIWDGGSTTSNHWTVAANWASDAAPTGNAGETLIFGASADRKATSYNNFAAGTSFSQIKFTDSGYTLSGNALTLAAGGIVATNTCDSNTIALGLTLDADETWSTVAGGTLNVTGTVNLTDTLIPSDHLLTVAGAGNVSFGSTSVISGAGGLTTAGSGTVTLAGNNAAYTGPTTVNAGTLIVQHNSALGTTGSGTTVVGGATLQVQGVTFSEPLTLAGDGSASQGALMHVSGNSTLSGNLTLNATSTINVVNADETLTISGAVSGIAGADLVKIGSGTLLLSNAANSYSGNTTISAGVLKLGAAGVIPDGSRVTLDNVAGVALDLNSHDETIGSLAGGGPLRRERHAGQRELDPGRRR